MRLAVVPVVAPGPGPTTSRRCRAPSGPPWDRRFRSALPGTPAATVAVEAIQYALIHLLRFCGEDDEKHCDDMADRRAAVAPGFDTASMDGPDGYGIYLTYTGDTDWGRLTEREGLG